ncbi:hypothetical protein JI735_19855 [Paenibacillus sonchi]|uniref:Uncharacterized protein n=1 Tax=Paenibacillus sonchi TaxID=373687 RepID=A0A974P7R2_9BACL|nr:hypothetical protein [Paenibacillus sonchi]QQZ58982.1 hypothetical protein JI735_19855 [Paenibacillus sonchi]
MQTLSDILVPGSVPNVIVNDKKGAAFVVFAVHHQGEAIVIGPVDGREKRNWLDSCWLINKNELLENYYLPYNG